MEATNESGFTPLDSRLVLTSAKMIVEESLQDNPKIRLVDDPSLADVFVYPILLSYQRPDIKFSLGIFSIKEETVALEMKIVFYEPSYDFYQTMKGTSSITKDIKSSFYTIVESENDFAESILFNLVKKTIDQCFEGYNKVIF